jgi:3',5'-cyclic-AMP phosphodiesterase
MTTILAQLSDPHIRVGPDDQGSGAALEAAVRSVLELAPPPVAVIVTGDLADGSTPVEYARFRELIAPLPVPVHVIPGNHDQDLDWEGPRAVACGDIRVVLCDTMRPGCDGGELDLDWLAAELEKSGAPTIVAMHHPPVLIGIGGLDAIGLAPAQRTALAEVLARAPHVVRVIAGHVHRSAFAKVGTTPVTTCASTNLQARLELGSPGFTIADEPPAFLVHTTAVAHVQPVTG